MDIFDKLKDLAIEQWPAVLGAAATFLVGRWWGRRRASAELSTKQFKSRMNFSLNRLEGDNLQIRTLRECELEDVWFNEAMRTRVRALADSTTTDDPVLPFTDDERWHYLNVVLNEVSEMFSAGLLKKDLGSAVAAAPYVVCLTNEKDGDMRTWKIRAMVIRADSLERILAMQTAGESATFERPHHITRWRTLVAIAKHRAADPARVLELELAS